MLTACLNQRCAVTGVLIEAGIIARKDSPTRKRYAHKDREGALNLPSAFPLRHCSTAPLKLLLSRIRFLPIRKH
ncbi:hypothetical protein HGG75_27565 [Ochrobactrum pseudogrignonense]|nr:hypothetical protein [Brucella pseudogrignonensis]